MAIIEEGLNESFESSSCGTSGTCSTPEDTTGFKGCFLTCLINVTLRLRFFL